MRTLVAGALAVGGLFTLTACGGTAQIRVSDGWQRVVDQDAALDIDGTFDPYTGDIVIPKGDLGTDGLSLPSQDAISEAFLDVDALRDAAIVDLCEDYIEEPWGDDPYWNQSWIVSRILIESISHGVVSTYSDEYIDASREVDSWLEAHGPDTAGIGIASPQYKQAQQERETLYEQRWSETYPHLLKEHRRADERWQSLRDGAYTAENVLAAQELIMSHCGFEVPGDYQHPSPQDLNIQVVED